MEKLNHEDFMNFAWNPLLLGSMLDYWKSHLKDLEDEPKEEQFNAKQSWEIREFNKPYIIEAMREIKKFERIKAIVDLQETIKGLRDKAEKVIKNGDEEFVFLDLGFRDSSMWTGLLSKFKKELE